MKAFFAHLLSADEDTFDEQLYGLLCMGPPARDAALSWLRSSEPLHRERACRVLAEVQDRPRAKNEPGWDVDHTPIPHLIRVLENDPDSDVRCAAARALMFQRQPKTIPPLLHAARQNDPDIDYWIAHALGSFQTDADELRPLLPAARQVMLRFLCSPDEDVRDWAAHSAQCDVFNTPAINAVLWRCTRDPDSTVRGEAISSLAYHGDIRVIPEIRRALQNPKTRVWIWVMEGIVALHAVELIPDLLAHGSSEALSAAEALQKNTAQRKASGVAPTV